MWNTGTLFDWLTYSTIGRLTTGVIPIIILFVITVLAFWASKYLSQRWGGTKVVGPWIVKIGKYVAATFLVISIFTTAYAYRGTPVNSRRNVSIVDAGPAVVRGPIKIPGGWVFTLANVSEPDNWSKYKAIYATDAQIVDKDIIVDGNTISVTTYIGVLLFMKEVKMAGL